MNSNDYNSLHEHNDTYEYSELGEEYIGALRGGCISAIGLAVTIAVVILTLFLFTGCKHIEYVAVPQLHTDTLYIHQQQRDSIYLHDSTFVNAGGDTVLIEKWHTRYIEKLRTDTLRLVVRDSVAYPIIKEKIVEVEKPTPLFIKILIVIGWLTLVAFVIWGAIKIRKYLP